MGGRQSDEWIWTGEGSFERGERYFRRGHILDPRRQGQALKARCLGFCPKLVVRSLPA